MFEQVEAKFAAQGLPMAKPNKKFGELSNDNPVAIEIRDEMLHLVQGLITILGATKYEQFRGKMADAYVGQGTAKMIERYNFPAQVILEANRAEDFLPILTMNQTPNMKRGLLNLQLGTLIEEISWLITCPDLLDFILESNLVPQRDLDAWIKAFKTRKSSVLEGYKPPEISDYLRRNLERLGFDSPEKRNPLWKGIMSMIVNDLYDPSDISGQGNNLNYVLKRPWPLYLLLTKIKKNSGLDQEGADDLIWWKSADLLNDLMRGYATGGTIEVILTPPYLKNITSELAEMRQIRGAEQNVFYQPMESQSFGNYTIRVERDNPENPEAAILRVVDNRGSSDPSQVGIHKLKVAQIREQFPMLAETVDCLMEKMRARQPVFHRDPWQRYHPKDETGITLVHHHYDLMRFVLRVLPHLYPEEYREYLIKTKASVEKAVEADKADLARRKAVLSPGQRDPKELRLTAALARINKQLKIRGS